MKIWLQGRMGQVVRIGVGLSLMFGISWYIDLPTLFESFSTIDSLMVVVLCLASCLDRVLMAYKWNLLLAARGVIIPAWQAIRLYVVGNLIGTVTPGGLGSDAYRVATLSSRHGTEIILSSVFLERLLGMAVIGFIAAGMLPFSASYFQADSSWVVGIVLGGALVMVLAIPFSLHQNVVNAILGYIPFISSLKITHKLKQFHRVYAESRGHISTLGIFASLTAGEVIFRIFLSYLAALALNIQVEFWFMLCMMPMVFILGRLPISLQGIGVQEGLFAYAMVLGGFAAENGVAVVLLLRAVGWVALVLPAVLFFLWPSSQNLGSMDHSEANPSAPSRRT